MTTATKGTLLVTGGSGFLGGNIIKKALERGYNVRATARSDSSTKKIGDQFPEYKDQLSYTIVPDFTETESYKDAFDGVTAVIHSASPFNFSPTDYDKDLFEPAVNGALAVLEAAKRWGSSVKAIVSTSSNAAVYDPSDVKRPGYVYSEKDWNPITHDEALKTDPVTAYCASKTFAERAEWEWMDKNKPSFTLTTITPPWIFGTYATELKSTAGLSESLKLLYDILDSDKIPPFDFGGYADVKEVAEAHLRSLEVPEAAGKRFWVGQFFQYQLAVDAARAELPELRDRLPVGNPGQLEDTYRVDGSTAEKVLGIKYGTLRDTMRETYLQFLNAERIEGKAK